MPNLMSCEDTNCCMWFLILIHSETKNPGCLWFWTGTPQGEINLLTNLRIVEAMQCNFIKTASHQGRRNPPIHIILEKYRNWSNSYFSCLATLTANLSSFPCQNAELVTMERCNLVLVMDHNSCSNSTAEDSITNRKVSICNSWLVI